MAFTKINAAGIGTTETVTVDGLTVINDGSFGGNLTVSGVLTYEDVTNVDSVGLITARNGIVVGSGITLSKDGDIFATGITTISGNVKVGTGITLSKDGDGFFTGVVTATSFVGSSGLNVLDGRVKIGTTSNTPASANEPGIVFGDNTAGTATKGIASFCANGAAPLLLTRRVSDGNVLGIADDTTTRGMVRVNSNDLEITAIEELRLSTGAGHSRKNKTHKRR